MTSQTLPAPGPASDSTRRLWLVGRGELTKRKQLGPAVRVLAMARQAIEIGLLPTVVLDTVEAGVAPGIETFSLQDFKWSQVGPQDHVVVSPNLPWKLLFPLLRNKLCFDVDSHGVGAVEGMETGAELPGWRLFQGRRRTALRLRLLLHRCEKIYLSIPEQLAFLGGSLFRESSRADVALASRLPEKVIYAPMGLVSRSFPTNQASPWPPAVGDRPVFLWGGGIWSWFDIPTLLQAFALLAEQNSPAALYFLAGINPSGISNQDAPVRQARETAARLGLLGRNVFFHDSLVTPSDLPKYLSHCRAGILANPARLESLASWRTRLLDLLWAAKPAVVSGQDPLSRRMAEQGCALVVPVGDATALAIAIQTLCDDPHTWNQACAASKAMAPSLDWQQTLSGIRLHWKTPPPENHSIQPASLLAILRCLVGL